MLGKASPLGQPNKLALMGTLGIPPREMAALSKQEVSLSQTEDHKEQGVGREGGDRPEESL